jgi:hypothetical protein
LPTLIGKNDVEGIEFTEVSLQSVRIRMASKNVERINLFDFSILSPRIFPMLLIDCNLVLVLNLSNKEYLKISYGTFQHKYRTPTHNYPLDNTA